VVSVFLDMYLEARIRGRNWLYWLKTSARGCALAIEARRGHVRWMVKVKFGSVVMVEDSRSGGGVVRQENSEGYIVVRRVNSAACR